MTTQGAHQRTDPAFYHKADPDPGSQINADADSDPGQSLPSLKVEFFVYIKKKVIKHTSAGKLF
jgi:hypothetical protein